MLNVYYNTSTRHLENEGGAIVAGGRKFKGVSAAIAYCVQHPAIYNYQGYFEPMYDAGGLTMGAW